MGLKRVLIIYIISSIIGLVYVYNNDFSSKNYNDKGEKCFCKVRKEYFNLNW